MSNTITRGQFIRELGADGGSLNINDLPPDLQKKLLDAGRGRRPTCRRSPARTRRSEEPGRWAPCSTCWTRSTPNGSSQSFAHRQSEAPAAAAHHGRRGLREAEGRGGQPAAGRAVPGDRPPGHAAGVRSGGAGAAGGDPGRQRRRARHQGLRLGGKVDYDGRRFDLGTDAGRQAFRDALVAGPDKVPASRADALVDQLGRVDVNTRDELAQLALALHRMGTGDLAANRLVISGHGSGRSVSGDGGSGWIEHQTIRDIARIFPEGAGKIEHLAMSSCYSAKPNELDQFRRDFPNLKSFWAYSHTSPLAESGAPAHLRTWASRTDGDDPSAVDPSGKNAASWNVVDGEQKFPSVTWVDAENALRASEGVWAEYQERPAHAGCRRTRSPAGSLLPGPAERPRLSRPACRRSPGSGATPRRGPPRAPPGALSLMPSSRGWLASGGALRHSSRPRPREQRSRAPEGEASLAGGGDGGHSGGLSRGGVRAEARLPEGPGRAGPAGLPGSVPHRPHRGDGGGLPAVRGRGGLHGDRAQSGWRCELAACPPRPAPGERRALGAGRRLLPLGGQAPADRGRVGAGGPRSNRRRPRLPLGLQSRYPPLRAGRHHHGREARPLRRRSAGREALHPPSLQPPQGQLRRRALRPHRQRPRVGERLVRLRGIDRRAPAGRNPRGPCPGQKTCPGARGHIIKGGGWRDDEFFSRIYNRNNPTKPYVVSDAGFRCAISISRKK